MFEDCKIEFYISPGGDVYVDDRGRESVYKLREDNHGLISYVATLIERQYPEAYRALEEEYRKSKPNTSYHRFLMVHRFIRCNFATYDGLRNDIEDNVLHIESVTCPLKWRGDCPLQGVVCNPKPLGLSKRESEVAKLRGSGRTYEEIEEELGISQSTIKNIIQKVKAKLKLKSSKDIAKLLVAVI